jgi:hypothetical protein
VEVEDTALKTEAIEVEAAEADMGKIRNLFYCIVFSFIV